MDSNINSAFLYGESIFITCKVVSGEIYDLDRHLAKLHDSVHKYFFTSINKKLEEKILSSLVFDSFTGALRVTIFKDIDGDLDAHISKRILDSFEKKPVRLKLIKRVQAKELDDFKVGSYGKEFYLKRLFAKEGIDDVLFYGEGKIFETSVANIFFRKDGKLITPRSGIYKGLTREKIIMSQEVEQRDVSVDELDSFDEIFICSSLYEKVNVQEIIKDE